MADSSSDFLRSINDGCDFLDEPACICDLCEQEGDQKPAVGFCSDCKDYLCQECYDTHLRPRPMRHHVLLDQHKMPKDQQQDRDRDTCTEACTVHPHKMLEYFCTDHGVFGCSACMTLHHRRCEGVDHIPDIAGDILDNVEYTDLQQRITSLTQLTTTAIRTSQDQVKRSQSYHTTALDSFQTFKKDMSKAIDRMEKAFNADADKIKEEDVTKAQIMDDKYKQALKGFQAIGSKFVSLQTSGQFCQLFIAMKRAKGEIDAIESQVIDKGQGTDVRNYRHVPSREAQKMLDSPETMVTLDIVTAAGSDHGKPTHPATPATSHQTLPSRQKVTSPVPGATDSENPQHKAIDTHAHQAHGKPAPIPGVTDSENPQQPPIDTQTQRVNGKPVPIPGATDSENQHRPATETQAQQAHGKPAPVPGATDSENPQHKATDTQAQQAHGKPAPVPGATDSENQHRTATDTQAQRVHGKPVPSTVLPTSHRSLPSRQKVPAPGAEARVPRVQLQQDRAVRKTRAHHVMDVRVGSSDDSRTPNITGCVVLPGDKLVLVDLYNDNVKLVDLTRGDVVSWLKLPGGIWDITNVSSTQVAVTSPYEEKIYFVNVGYKTIWGHTLKLDRKIKVKGQCYGIARINDNLVVSYDEPVKVEIISKKGKVLQTVVTEDKGKQLFTSLFYIAVSKDQQTVYISDYDRHTVTSVDLAGRVQATYKDDKLKRPRGLTVDTAGTVYVCGVLSSNVLQLTADLTEERQLLQGSDGVRSPESICYCEATDRLYVGMWNSHVVKVFQMK